MSWNLQGTYVGNCSCDVVCPCTASGFSAPADYDRCQVLGAFHIVSDVVDGTDVSDLNVAVVGDTPAQMSDGNWRVGLLMDERADNTQAQKLAAIFGGQMGGPMATIAPLIGENLGMERAPIEISDNGRRHKVKIGDQVFVEIEDAASPFDPEGEPPKITASRHFANATMTVARALASKVRAFGLDFSLVGQSGFSTNFSWTG
ncbi:MAG: DUF1326 domain-containing protein [Gammaproteobacteria bacterium]|nr:DUF1326 domain-containing protein [Gammaproteobacteria bacterium]